MSRFILILLLISSSLSSAADRPSDALQSPKMIALLKNEKEIEAQRTSAPSHIYAPQTEATQSETSRPQYGWLIPTSISLGGLFLLGIIFARSKQKERRQTDTDVASEEPLEQKIKEKVVESEATNKPQEISEVEAASTQSTLSTTDQLFLEKALVIVEANIGNADFNASDFTKEMGMSKTHLYRKLDQLTQESPGRYIRRMRLAKAHELLLAKNGNVTEVAYEVGFNNLSYFAKCFRKQYGIPPSNV